MYGGIGGVEEVTWRRALRGLGLVYIRFHGTWFKKKGDCRTN